MTAYDTVAYPSRCYPQAHPDRLATLATLFGMAPPPAASCRFLELGCGDGGHLLGLAFALPGSSFVGVDLAPSAIRRAADEAKALGLSNVRFDCADLLEWTPPEGPFDFIVAHGLFSWVPEPIRLRVLELCRERLAPQGVAYVSYNALPGRHVSFMLGEMMRYHGRHAATSAQQIAQARDLLGLLMTGPSCDDELVALITNEAERVQRHDDALLFHDLLAEVNRAFYFHEFMELAGRYGLQFLAEAEFSEMQEAVCPPAALAVLRRLGNDVVARQQYLDFLTGRRFRQTLLCREGVALGREPKPAVLRRFLLASQAEARSARPDLAPGTPETFTTPRGVTMQTADPLTRAAMLELRAAWPRSMSLDALVEAACRRLGQAPAANDADRLAADLLAACGGSLVVLRLHEPAWAACDGRPVLSPLARWQLTNGRETATSLLHADVLVEGSLRDLFLLLDGSRDVPAIAAELARRAEAGELTLPSGGTREGLPTAVAGAIRGAADKGLLVAWGP